MKTTTNTKKVVVKFGGSNLKTKEDFGRVYQVITLYRDCQQPIVIVISAIYGVTDILQNTIKKVKTDEHAISGLKQNLIDLHHPIIQLFIKDSEYRQQVLDNFNARVEELGKYLQGIHCLGEIPDFVEDRVLSYGERFSSLVLTAILNFMNIPCIECLPEELGLFTNGEYRNASVNFSLAEEAVKKCLPGNHTYVVPGFYGISTDSKVTLFGRGGSDYTAAAIARCIDAASVDLWKDVPGFMSADPKLVKNPIHIDKLTYNEAAELSYFGARIIHPRTFEPVLEKKIPVRLFDINNFSNTLEPVTTIRENGVIKEGVAPPTYYGVCQKNKVSEGSNKKGIIKSVTSSDDFGVLKLHGAGVGIKPGIMARVTNKLNDEGINIKSIITSQTCINILLSRDDLEKGLQIVKKNGLSAVEQISTLENISLIAVVGEGILEQPGIAARVLGAVSNQNINVWTISAGASNVTIYFIIAQKNREKAIQAIHKEIFGEVKNNEPRKTCQYDNYPATLGYII
jgi:aspartokinase/homoserine dehydrogenase 1